MPGAIRIAVIDDHPMFREGAVQTLTCIDGLEVVGEGATAADALKVAEELRPDVMLLDISLPGGGVEVAASIAVRAIFKGESYGHVDVSPKGGPLMPGRELPTSSASV